MLMSFVGQVDIARSHPALLGRHDPHVEPRLDLREQHLPRAVQTSPEAFFSHSCGSPPSTGTTQVSQLKSCSIVRGIRDARAVG